MSAATRTRADAAASRLTRLDNGLRVAVEQVPGMTGCAVAVGYRAGYRDEPEPHAGFAHLFEHLMFQGSAHVAAGQHFAEVQAAGGTVNGNTFPDLADYHQVAPVGSLGRILALEADRMDSLEVTEHNLEVQRRVVVEEINLSVRGRAYGGFPWTVLPEATYTRWHNAHNGFGTPDELDRAGLDECAAFYAGHYAPGNACAAVCADLPVDRLADEVHAAFAGVGARPVPVLVRPDEPDATPCELLRHDPLAPRPALALGWPLAGPEADLATYAAATVLQALLSRGSPAVLREALREHDCAVDTSVGLFGPLLGTSPETFVVVVHHPPGRSELVHELVRERLAALGEGVPEQHAESAVLSTLAEHWKRMDQPAQRARALGRGVLLMGRPRLSEQYAAAVREVSGDDVARLARRLAAGPAGVVRLEAGAAS